MIHIYLPFLPPRLSEVYDNVPKTKIGPGKFVGGGRRLTKKGKAFKNDVKQIILKKHAMQTGQLGPTASIGLYIAFGTPNLLNKGYPEKTKARYKKLDAPNRRKALDDGLAEVINFDDSQFIFDVTSKYLAEQEETHIWIWNEDDERIGAHLTTAFGERLGIPAEVQPD